MKDSLDLAVENLISDRAIAFRSAYKRITGSYCAALLLAQLMYWRTRAGNEWIYKTDAELGEEICASEDELQTARARLKKLGLVLSERRGLPAKMHYKVVTEKLIEMLSTPNMFRTTSGTDSGDHPSTSSGQPPEHTYTEMTTEMTDRDIAPTGAQTPPEEQAQTESTVQGEGGQGAQPPERQRPDPLDTYAAWQQAAAKPAQPQHIIAAKYRRHDLVPLCESFESVTGMQMQDQPAGLQKRWLRDLGEWAAVGITPDQVRDAYVLTRPDKRGKGGYSVSAPGSLNSAIAQVRATPAKPKRDYTQATSEDYGMVPQW